MGTYRVFSAPLKLVFYPTPPQSHLHLPYLLSLYLALFFFLAMITF